MGSQTVISSRYKSLTSARGYDCCRYRAQTPMHGGSCAGHLKRVCELPMPGNFHFSFSCLSETWCNVSYALKFPAHKFTGYDLWSERRITCRRRRLLSPAVSGEVGMTCNDRSELSHPIICLYSPCLCCNIYGHRGRLVCCEPRWCKPAVVRRSHPNPTQPFLHQFCSDSLRSCL